MNFNNILEGFMKNGAASGLATGLVGGLAGSMLTSKAGRKFGKNALKVGGVAAVGALAYGAYKKYAAKQHGIAPQAEEQTVGSQAQIDAAKFLPEENDRASLRELETYPG